MTIFIQEDAFENVVWKMAAICLNLNALIPFIHVYNTGNHNMYPIAHPWTQGMFKVGGLFYLSHCSALRNIIAMG